MKLSLEYDVFENGTAAVEVDGTRVVYLHPNGDGTVTITVVPYNAEGYSPMRQPRFKSNVAAVKRRKTQEMKNCA